MSKAFASIKRGLEQAIRGSGNVFRDLGFDKAEAENLKLRCELMMRISRYYAGSGMNQVDAAKTLGVTQPHSTPF